MITNEIFTITASLITFSGVIDSLSIKCNITFTGSDEWSRLLGNTSEQQHDKTCLGFPIRSKKYRAVQRQMMVRGLKFKN